MYESYELGSDQLAQNSNATHRLKRVKTELMHQFLATVSTTIVLSCEMLKQATSTATDTDDRDGNRATVAIMIL
jgi:hypothetical protein